MINDLKAAKTCDVSFTSRNWKDATGEKGGFCPGEKGGFCHHEASSCHKAAVEAVVTLPKTTGDIVELLSSAHAKEKASNQKNLMTVARCLRFIARQGLAILGDGDEMDSNFHQLLLILKRFDDVTIHALLAKKQDKYTSPQIQNKLLQTMVLLSSVIREAKYFTIMADDVTDASKS